MVYPNPTNNWITISFTAKANYTITLTDLMGKELQQITVNNQPTVQLNLSHYADGIYLVKVPTNGYSKTQKIVVKH